MDYEKELKKAKTFVDIFEIVKGIVREHLGIEQAGLLVGVTDLGGSSQAFVGAFYSLDANTIIINKRPLARILQTSPSLYNYYIFHVMMHEYVHSIGSYDEWRTRQLVYEISEHYFGRHHTITQLASDIGRFMPNLTFSIPSYQPPQDASIEFVKGIDRKNTNYIN
ncbi:hypothetical protein HYY70_05670 [Candidatus Woesearchaeota archaeon]|nr:hypothetical protein [Candidatus Woesearchaeota archaeon]